MCRGAKADIVFLTDASWSIGDDNFNKVVKFIFNTVGAFDEISPAGIQVSFVQYSDEVKSEFKLNTYNDKALALGALQNIRYRGGNTRTGQSARGCQAPLSAGTGGAGCAISVLRFLSAGCDRRHLISSNRGDTDVFHATLCRQGPHVHQGEGADLGERHEEECPQGAGRGHGRAVTG